MYTRFPRQQSTGRTILTLFPAFVGVCLLLFICLASSIYTPRIPSMLAPPVSKLSVRDAWAFESAPPFCEKLIANPLPNDRCKRDQETQECPDGSVRMMGQFNQDHYLFTRHFARLPRRGVYLDVAANHATDISNSFFMDACLGWDGLCVEANPEYHAALRQKRTCALVPTCASDRDGDAVSFIAARGSGGIRETNKHVLLRDQGQSSGSVMRETARLNLTCTTIGRELRERQVALVDYMSLDVEGHELKVLNGIDWTWVRINVITVEATKKMARRIEAYIKPKGYRRHYPVVDGKRAKGLKGDVIFLHKSVVFGKPT